MVAGICPRRLFAYIRIRLDSREEEATSAWERELMHEDALRARLREKRDDVVVERARLPDRICFPAEELREELRGRGETGGGGVGETNRRGLENYFLVPSRFRHRLRDSNCQTSSNVY